MGDRLPKDKLSKAAIVNINKWLSEPKYVEYKPELESLVEAGDWKALEDAFFKVIEFGTGGRRGTTGVGSNRINKVTIGESAQALCEHALSFDKGAGAKGIVIACDTRLSSPELSRYTAQVIAANGFKAYIFDSFRSTPELSFAVRELGCAAGIVISASHNPPADNGFKAYWSDGGQVVPPHDQGILDKASQIKEIKVLEYDEAVESGQIVIIGQDIDSKYIAALSNEAMSDNRDVSIVYSPLHGAGLTNVLPALQAVGFESISTVKDQMVPDGNFPTVANGKPNPEERAANDRAVAQLMSEAADIAITNDPDADRIGVVVRQGDEPIYLNGNQSAVLATDYVLSKLKQRDELTSSHYIAKTIVTTDMLKALADNYGVKLYTNMLIGFKYIGELILKKEGTGEIFVIGSEESYGLLKGTYARDKDGAVGALVLAEYAAELKSSGRTLYDRLLELYAKYGLYTERLDMMVCPGADGFNQMQSIMDWLRNTPPEKIGKQRVTAVQDYKSLKRKTMPNNQSSSIDCLSGNVIVLEFGDSRKRITIRPSGTEPKLKFYTQWFESPDDGRSLQDQYQEIEASMEGLSKELAGVLFEL